MSDREVYVTVSISTERVSRPIADDFPLGLRLVERVRTVKCYTHWTQAYLTMGNERDRLKALRWLRRKARMNRKRRRGWT